MRSIDEVLLEYRTSSGPSSLSQIQEAQAALAMPVPPDLAEFLTSRGPGEGFAGDGSYLSITPPEGWASKHEILEAAKKWPGLLIFGSDGGGEFFGFDQGSRMYVEV